MSVVAGIRDIFETELFTRRIALVRVVDELLERSHVVEDLGAVVAFSEFDTNHLDRRKENNDLAWVDLR
jgi:hypothetical protein